MLMQPDTELARKSLALVFVAGRHTTTLDYVAMGQALEISAEDAQALCPSVREKITKRYLTRHALNVLSNGHHADMPDELFCEPGVGQVSVTEIHLRPDERGASLRSPY